MAMPFFSRRLFLPLFFLLTGGILYFIIALLPQPVMSTSVDEAEHPTEYTASADTAVFAGGCFWCMEPPFQRLDGVLAVTSGYAGGDVADPTYEEVTSGGTGHAEVVQVIYDSDVIGYEELLEVYWRNIDPLTPNRQFCDVGSQYRPAIFYNDDEQRRLAEASKNEIDESERFEHPVVVEIEPLNAFYRAEEYHQNYAQKNPRRYQQYREACGRDERLENLWGEN